jgi:hypothetical protein
MRDLTLLLVDDASVHESAALPLVGKTRGEALEWMRVQSRRRGLDGERLRTRLHFAIAPHPTDDGRPFEDALDGGLRELALWYGNGNFLLESQRQKTEGAGPVRCWPHHFDIATLVRLPGTGSLQTIGIGLSPGDQSYPEPYFYVSPQPTPKATVRPLSIGRWHTEGWWGAALLGSEIVKHAAPGEQAALVTHFINEASARLLETNRRAT